MTDETVSAPSMNVFADLDLPCQEKAVETLDRWFEVYPHLRDEMATSHLIGLYHNISSAISEAVSAEREECAKIAEEYPWEKGDNVGEGIGMAKDRIAEDIRSRQEKT